MGKWFSNLDVVENVNQHGIGFGISICKRLINKLGGEFYFENNRVIGSPNTTSGLTVTIELPFEKVSIIDTTLSKDFWRENKLFL